MLEVGRVVDAGGEQYRGGIGHVPRRQPQQRFLEFIGIVVHRPDWQRAEYQREGTLENLAVFQHVGYAGRATQVVFQHVHLAIGMADEVRARNMAPHAPWRIETLALGAVGAAVQDQLPGDDTVVQNFLVVVDIIDEEVQRLDTLFQNQLR